MTKRPSVMGAMSIDDLMGSVPAPEPEPMPVESARAPVAEPEPEAPITAEAEPEAPTKSGRKPVPDVFRTSLYFHRTVHDALREIAFGERATVSDLINEGLDMVLKARGYPSAADLKAKGLPKRKRAGVR